MAARPDNDRSAFLDDLVAAAIRRDVPVPIAEDAKRATRRRLVGAGALDTSSRRRIEAYFSAVVRRQVTRRGVAPRAAARLVVATVVDDLRASGRDAQAIWAELERGWRRSVPAEVLEEYRLRLCG